MSEEKIKRLENLADEHDKRISHSETKHAVNDERFKGWDDWRKRVDTRLRNTEGNISWGVRIVIALIITAIVSLAVKSGNVL